VDGVSYPLRFPLRISLFISHGDELAAICNFCKNLWQAEALLNKVKVIGMALGGRTDPQWEEVVGIETLARFIWVMAHRRGLAKRKQPRSANIVH